HGGVLEGFGRQSSARILMDAFRPSQALEQPIVIAWVAHGHDVREVLRGRAQERLAPDVDIFESVVQARAGGAHDLEEWVQIDGYQIDRLQTVAVELQEMSGVVTQGENAAVHSRMERLDPPTQHLGEARELLYTPHGDARLAQQAFGTARRKQLEAQRLEPASEGPH